MISMFAHALQLLLHYIYFCIAVILASPLLFSNYLFLEHFLGFFFILFINVLVVPFKLFVCVMLAGSFVL